MDVIIVIVFCILLLVGTLISDIRARKSNKLWLEIKAKAIERLADYEADSEATDENKNHAKWVVHRYCEVCEKIAAGGLFDSKQNMLYAGHSTILLNELKRIGFFGKSKPEKDTECSENSQANTHKKTGEVNG